MKISLLDSKTLNCGLTLKNRIVLAPLTNSQSPSTELSEDEFRWLEKRIRGGFGLVTSCATHVMKKAQAWEGQLGIYSDQHMPGWQRLARSGTQEHSLVIPQLFHGGFRCPSQLNGKQPVSASEFEIKAPDFERPRALLDSEIHEIKEHFVSAAKRAIASGLPGVEVHGANGYLFTQFLSSQTNTRTDRWGGNAANRSRFLLETVKEIRQAIGRDKVLGVRISPENTKLIHSIDINEMMDLAFSLNELGVDYISLSLWDAFKIPDKFPDGKISIVEMFRKFVPDSTAISASGKIWTLSDALRVSELGADLLVLGGVAIANPNWPKLIGQPGYQPQKFPLTREQFHEAAVSDRFVDYLKRWGFVLGET